MEEILRHTINKLILPKYGDISDFVTGISYSVGEHYSYYFVVYDVILSISPLDMRKIRDETDILFNMLGPRKLDEVEISFKLNNYYA